MSADQQVCKEALQELKNAIIKNIAISDRNNILKTEYNGLLDAYNNANNMYWSTHLPNWQTAYNDTKKALEDEIKLTYNGGCISYPEWCTNDFGSIGFTNDGGDLPPIPWSCNHKRKCKRSDSQVSRDLNQWENQNKRPIPPTKPQEPSYENFILMPQAPINCCSNEINIIASQVTDSDLSQLNNCIATVENTISQPSPTPAPTPAQTPTQTPSPTPVPTPDPRESNNILYIVLFILLLILLFIIIILLFNFLFGDYDDE